MAYNEENTPMDPLPAVAAMPSEPRQMTMEDLIEFNDMNGVNASMNALVNSGMTPEQAGMMLERAGIPVGDLAKPEDLGGSARAAGESEVRRAEPAMRPTGSVFGLGFIDQINGLPEAEARKAYDALTPVQKRIYDRSYGYEEVTAAKAEQWSDEFFKEQQQQNDPKAAAAQKQQQQADMASARSALETADNIVNIMDRLRGFSKGEKGSENKTPKYLGRVGTFDSRFPAGMSGDRNAWFIDFKALQDQLSLAARGALKGTGPISNFEQEMLRNAAMGGLDYGRDDASFSQVFEQTYDIAKRKRDEQRAALESMSGGSKESKAAASPAPSSAPSLPFRLGQTITDRFGNVGIFRGMDASGKPIIDSAN